MKEQTIEVEDKYSLPFFEKTKIAFTRGSGVYVWDEDDKKYIDFTAGWGVTCIGHANPVIVKAIYEQSKKIIQNPNSGATYSPIRAKLLNKLSKILPLGIDKIFFVNSGAEANDAAIKMARKISGKKKIVSTYKSFHGRTIGTISATGQKVHRDKFNPILSNHLFVEFNDIDTMQKVLSKKDAAAVIIEPIQGEGGVNIPKDGYLEKLSQLCKEYDVFLIMDEIQTGFYRTGKPFFSNNKKISVDFITMGKGIAGGFPFAGFATTSAISKKIEIGDHGGTYCGNPLGCAAAYAVLTYLLENDITKQVEKSESIVFNKLNEIKLKFPQMIKDIRGKGLLIALQLYDDNVTKRINEKCLKDGLILNIKQGNIIRIFPALNITEQELCAGLKILKKNIESESN